MFGRHRFLFVVLAILVATFPLRPLAASTLHVAVGGDDSGGDGSLAYPYATITHAYTQAAGGDTVLVLPGEYAECVVAFTYGSFGFEDKPVDIVASDFVNHGDNTTTVIRGDESCWTVVMAGNVSLSGFTVTDGGTSGIYIFENGVVTNNLVTDNSAIRGGGVYAYAKVYGGGDSRVAITDNEIVNNRAEFTTFGGEAGGLLVAAGGSSSYVLVDGNVIRGNVAEGRRAGGLQVSAGSFVDGYSEVVITNNVITENLHDSTIRQSVGGVEIYVGGQGDSRVTFSQNQVTSNESRGGTGGLTAQVSNGFGGVHELLISDNVIAQNVAAEWAGGALLGANLYLPEADDHVRLEFFDNLVVENENALGTGGVYCSLQSTGGNRSSSTVRVSRNTIARNRAAILGGGARMFSGITGHSQSSLPGPAEGGFEFVGNLVIDNVVTDGSGGGVLVGLFAQGEAISNGRLSLNTVANNAAMDGAGGIELGFTSLFDSTGTHEGFNRFVLDNSIVAANSGFGLGGRIPWSFGYDIHVEYSNVTGHPSPDYESWVGDWTGIEQNISLPPMFMNPAAEDYRLLEDSPAIDTGDPGIVGAPAVDIGGLERIVDGDDDGVSIIDMGAHEYAVIVNTPPVASISPLVPVECDSPSGGAVALDGSGSSDADSTTGTNDDIKLFEWFEDYGMGSEAPLGAGPSLVVTLPLGEHSITLRVTDNADETGTAETTVIVQDTGSPSITVGLVPDSLWPPNHMMVDVGATVVATDACGTPVVELTSVTSNEPDNGAGDGDTVDDIQGVAAGSADFAFQLRAERAGGGSGRTYTVTYTATDGSGNTKSVDSPVTVDHSRGGVIEPLILSVGETIYGTLLTWTDVPAATLYDVIRGDLADLNDKVNHYELQRVSCIESGSTDASTIGHEDTETPVAGQVFYYVAEYFDGMWRSHGTESAAKPRVPRAGDCRSN